VLLPVSIEQTPLASINDLSLRVDRGPVRRSSRVGC
jgi:hypothetical protein